jgi:hypothetical protein
VDQRGLVAAAGVDVAVQGVVAHVELAVGEPAGERGAAVVERAGRAPGPVDRGGGLEPEPLRVLDAGPEHVVVLAHADPSSSAAGASLVQVHPSG